MTNHQGSLLEKERKVIENCLMVRYAVESWSADNGGRLPGLVTEVSPRTGSSVMEYLPQGRLLLNPLTGWGDSPCDGLPTNQGQTGYLVMYNDSAGAYDGYRIEGLGGNHCTLFSIVYPPE